MQVANKSLFINTALLLWAFNISQDENPEKKIDTLAFTNTANSHPLPFCARFRKRFDGVKDILETCGVEEY